MLATFVIALREGLEAALIVGIIAAFLRKNGKSLTAMWAGVLLAVVLSVLVGVGLSLTERALPQASQEAMEATIGLVAVFFVTGMVMWMNNHAHEIKRQLESEAAAAIGQSSALALASMAFLAVLKEGFETSVFLLATFSVAQSAAWAAAGAVLGLILAVAIGWGIYMGGVKLNLGRFFRYTGMFLILVAAGLIISALRSGHEAGWLNIGQDRVFNLSWFMPPGSVRSALMTGVLGIPTDPRVLELSGWGIYVLLVAVLVYWPRQYRPQPVRITQMLLGSTAILVVAALALLSFYPQAQLGLPVNAPLQGGGQAILQAQDEGGYQLHVSADNQAPVDYTLSSADQKMGREQGVDLQEWSLTQQAAVDSLPTMLTLDQVLALYGHRIPVGLSPAQHPGPYNVTWRADCAVEAAVTGNALYNASAHATILMTLSGSGLLSPRTFTVRSAMPEIGCNWQLDPRWQQQVSDALQHLRQAQVRHTFWANQLPLLLGLMAIISLILALRRLSASRRASAVSVAGSRSTLPENK